MIVYTLNSFLLLDESLAAEVPEVGELHPEMITGHRDTYETAGHESLRVHVVVSSSAYSAAPDTMEVYDGCVIYKACKHGDALYLVA